ncbi:MAG: tRNA preQ1(34) S-adenosylmethionine ribosyltransferase-isomerase QueA [Clostridia bacterium]|jgi:S-adenosylmethionine:tRNA ribosyltransferase-isomerase|nr:tRNA preQ1(34) S-adenosylmethionine ribosyltransferase-isomerase QueA [Clostridia bacterium]
MTNENQSHNINDNKLLLKSSYYYDLPEELIAQTPVEPRDSSRLLVYDKTNNKIEHKIFHDIVEYLKAGDILVINNTRVLPARLFGYKDTGAKIEILLQKRINLTDWEVIAKPAKRLSEGTIVTFNEKLSCEIISKGEYGSCKIKFIFEGVFEERLAEVGQVPLPPYIHNKLKNKERYQTVYSKIEGSSAAPTAGLHFTQDLLQKIKDKGVQIVEVLLHVGLGTFRPVKEDNILNHEMHSEYIEMSEENARILNQAKKDKRRIIAVGTTSIRVLESCVNEEGIIIPQKRDTNIFIYPPYKFKVVDALITNFHLPESTLIMLISAFAGYENIMNVYKTAVKEKYRFFSFGDAMFIY